MKKTLQKSICILLALLFAFQVLPLDFINGKIQQAYAAGVEQRATRSFDELLEDENVQLDDDGNVATILNSNSFTKEELQTLFANSGVDLKTGEEAVEAKKEIEEESLRIDFGFSAEQIEKSSALHGSTELLLDELINFNLSKTNSAVTTSIQSEVTLLIANGYTNSEAFAAIVASDLLGFTIDDLINAKAAEIEAEHDEESDIDSFFTVELPEDVKNDNHEYIALSVKLGVPYSLIESYMENSIETADEITAQYDAARQQAYPPSNAFAKYEIDSQTASGMQMATSATSSSYYPAEILEKTFTYDKAGNVDVNLNTGSYTYTETDLHIPGKNGLDLTINRVYNSTLMDVGMYCNIKSNAANTFKAGYTAYRQTGTDSSGRYIFTKLTNVTDYILPSDPTFQSYIYGISYSSYNYAYALGKKELISTDFG